MSCTVLMLLYPIMFDLTCLVITLPMANNSLFRCLLAFTDSSKSFKFSAHLHTY